MGRTTRLATVTLLVLALPTRPRLAAGERDQLAAHGGSYAAGPPGAGVGSTGAMPPMSGSSWSMSAIFV
jgi:hypothetical protein